MALNKIPKDSQFHKEFTIFLSIFADSQHHNNQWKDCMHGAHGVKDVYQYAHSRPRWIFKHFQSCVETGVSTFFVRTHGLYI